MSGARSTRARGWSAEPELPTWIRLLSGAGGPVTLIASAGITVSGEALIDTGAELSLFDERLATELGLWSGDLATINLSGVGGLLREAKLAEATINLLDQPELQITIEAAFAPDVELTFGNLIGLDVLEHFDFALSHRERIGYLGRSPA